MLDNSEDSIQSYYREWKQAQEFKKCEIETIQRSLVGLAVRKDSLAKLRKISENVSVKDFILLKQLGEGASGKVYLVQKQNTNEVYAMKLMPKTNKKMLKYAKAERDILAENTSSWIVNLIWAFQDEANLYLVMEYQIGGDLTGLLIREKTLIYSTIVFYAAELVSSVEFLHTQEIIHRDIKPNNILIDKKGHLKLADFGLAAKLNEVPFYKSPDQSLRKMGSRVGTPDYIAPEVIDGYGYWKESDWWSVGIIIYEMFTGTTPFRSKNASEAYRKILNWQFTLQIPSNIPLVAVSLIKGLVQWKHRRLGRYGSDEVKKHPFFTGIVWKDIGNLNSPFIPKIRGSNDTRYFDSLKEITSEDEISTNSNIPLLTLSGYSFTRK